MFPLLSLVLAGFGPTSDLRQTHLVTRRGPMLGIGRVGFKMLFCRKNIQPTQEPGKEPFPPNSAKPNRTASNRGAPCSTNKSWIRMDLLCVNLKNNTSQEGYLPTGKMNNPLLKQNHLHVWMKGVSDQDDLDVPNHFGL